MRLSYTDVLGSGERREISATITTDHQASIYGKPVIVLEDGSPLDATSWALMGYTAQQVSEDELPLMQRWLSNLYLLLGQSAVASRAGSTKSERKSAAARENGKLGGRPRKTGEG